MYIYIYKSCALELISVQSPHQMVLWEHKTCTRHVNVKWNGHHLNEAKKCNLSSLLFVGLGFQSRAIPLSIIAPSADWKSGSGLNVLLSNILWQPCMLVLQGPCVTAAFEHAPSKRLLNRNDKETWQALKMNFIYRYNCASAHPFASLRRLNAALQL